jgi:hypothetical protein
LDWTQQHIGVEGDAVEIRGEKVWKQKWRAVEMPSLRLPHPSYPHQYHDFHVYQIGDTKELVRFAAGELSNGVWGFYVPK